MSVPKTRKKTSRSSASRPTAELPPSSEVTGIKKAEGEIVLAPLRDERSRALEQHQQFEENVLKQCLSICEDQGRAFDLDPENPTVPDYWRGELPDEAAVQRRMRIAKAALLPPKDAPIALSTAKAVVLGMTRARHNSQIYAPRQLNVVAIVVNTAEHQYPEQEVED